MRLFIAHYHDLNDTVSFADLIPVDEVNKSEITKGKLAVFHNDGFASAEQAGTEVSIGVEASLGLLIRESKRKLYVLRAGMMILTLGTAGGDKLLHNLDDIHLQELSAEVINVVRALLDHYGAGGVMRVNSAGTHFDTGLFNCLLYLRSNIVEAGHMVMGMNLDLFEISCHWCILLK